MKSSQTAAPKAKEVKELMKVVNTGKYITDDSFIVPGIDRLRHWQDCPVITLCMDIKPMNDSVLKTYKIKDSTTIQEIKSLKSRDNFREQENSNFKSKLFKNRTFHNKAFKKLYKKRIK